MNKPGSLRKGDRESLVTLPRRTMDERSRATRKRIGPKKWVAAPCVHTRTNTLAGA